MKRVFRNFLLSAALVTGVFLAPQHSAAECEHYFKVEHIDGINYLIEYSCDGTVVNVTILED